MAAVCSGSQFQIVNDVIGDNVFLNDSSVSGGGFFVALAGCDELD